jgi:UDP-glucose 4-epimerase
MTSGVVVVTGAAGFIGHAVAVRMHAAGHDVIALDDFSSGASREVVPGVPVIDCDLRVRDQLEAHLPQHVDAIVHCAAQSSGEVSFDDPWDDMTRHVEATLRLLESAAARRVPRLVYTSSMAAYGDPEVLPASESARLLPLSFYGAGKAATENYVRLYARYGIDSTILRPFSVYGAGQDLTNLRQGMISIYLAQLLRTGRIVVKGSLDRFRDFVHIEDAVDAIVSVLDCDVTRGQTMNLCSGRGTTVREVLETLLELAAADWDVVDVVDGTPGDQFGMFGDNALLRELTGWAPRWTVEDGIKDMWSRANDPMDGGNYA